MMYPAVSGNIRNGSWTVLAVGDMISGYTYGGKLVTGRVIATHPYYPSVTVEGISGYGEQIRRSRWSVEVKDVLTSIRREEPIAV